MINSEPRSLHALDGSQDEEDMELDRLAGLAPMPATELDPPKTVRPAKAQEEEVIAKDTDDAYEECYPDYGGFSGAVIDSDEEDLSHMDNKEGRSRYDFGTEQEWEVRGRLVHWSVKKPAQTLRLICNSFTTTSFTWI